MESLTRCHEPPIGEALLLPNFSSIEFSLEISQPKNWPSHSPIPSTHPHWCFWDTNRNDRHALRLCFLWNFPFFFFFHFAIQFNVLFSCRLHWCWYNVCHVMTWWMLGLSMELPWVVSLTRVLVLLTLLLQRRWHWEDFQWVGDISWSTKWQVCHESHDTNDQMSIVVTPIACLVYVMEDVILVQWKLPSCKSRQSRHFLTDDRCPSGHCSSSISKCLSQRGCSDSASFLCADGTCVSRYFHRNFT